MAIKPKINKPCEINIETWMKLFVPLDNKSGGGAGVTIGNRSTLIFDCTNLDDLGVVNSSHPRNIWTLLENREGGMSILNGIHFTDRVGYLVSNIGIDEGDIVVPLRDGVQGDFDLSDIEEVDGIRTCEHGCQVGPGEPVFAYLFEGFFSHYYCGCCGNTISGSD